MSLSSNKNEGFQIRPYSTLPAVNIGWLKLKDHFISTVGPYAGQGEPLKNLLVIADATIQPKSSFPKHPHKDMEILTWVVNGTLHHMDDKGSDQFVSSPSLQLMSARNGIFHAEGNSSDEGLRILQIWIHPKEKGGTPEVKAQQLSDDGLELMAGPSGAPLVIRQDLWLYAALVSKRQKFEIPDGQFGYGVFVGKLNLNERNLSDGDGVILGAGGYEVVGNGQMILVLQDR